MTSPRTPSREGKCDICGAPFSQIVSCTMDGCPIPPLNHAEREKFLAQLYRAVGAQASGDPADLSGEFDK